MSDQRFDAKTMALGLTPNSKPESVDLPSDLATYQGSYVSGKQPSSFTEQKQRQGLGLLAHNESGDRELAIK